MENIGGFIKERRQELGLTQREVAIRVGVTEAAVSRWESGEIGTMMSNKIVALAKCLDINPLLLLGMDVEKTEKAPTPKSERVEEWSTLFQTAPPDIQEAVLTLLRSWAARNQ